MNNNDNSLIMVFNGAGVVAAYVLLGFSLYLSTDVPLSTKGFWGIGVLMLTISLVNFVKYRFDAKADNDRIRRIEEAKNEEMLAKYVTKD
ncbi:hypothetical protein RXV86_01050 [Alisedimentitalea sp. MJ-SS2]|uniref:hypothetical protein n=1 Tax=Aliisedimentitalea sp. MJ-SS2 TaxID=3049795 RepID=UPI00290969E0|nr:hypothetical protein [Alisedimentitalea sp. MJ-SS2]MDU8925961.1 hypothetical protein [Alisedimentitalea sp. MJ-SS2]